MPELIADSSFDINRSYEYHLSIQVSLDGFSFFIVDSQQNKLVAFKYENLKISSENFLARRMAEWFNSEELLRQNYKKTSAVVFEKKAALVPEIFALHEKNQSVLAFLYPLAKNETITENRINNSGKVLYFALSQQLQEMLNSRLPECGIYHPLTLIAENLPLLPANSQKGLFLLFQRNSFFFLFFDENGVAMVNSYPFYHENDVIYYVVSAMNQLGISAQKTQIFLAGSIDEKSSVLNALQKPFKTCELYNTVKNVQVAPEWLTGMRHQFIALLQK